ncbi:MAG: TonB-dependent receptor [Parabacteroides sp.]
MKTIYQIRALCLLAFLGTTLAANAQEDEKKKTLNREMTLEREYDPTVQDASKVNTLPEVKEPEVHKIPVDYADFTVPTEPQKEISLLPSGNVMTEIAYNKRRGYFNFGGGTHLNLNGDLGYHILSTDVDQLSLSVSHRSTNGNVKYLQNEEKVKAKLNDNLGGIRYAHTFNKAILNLGVHYGYSAFNYYGWPINLSSEAPQESIIEQADRETNQVNQTIAAAIGVESKEGADLGYLLDVGLINFSHKYGISSETDGPKETTVEAKFGINKGFNGNMRVGVDGLVEYFNYSLPQEKTLSDGSKYSCEFENHAEVTLSPYYKVEGESWHVKLGAHVMVKTGENDLFMASPNVQMDVEVADKTQLYLKADGKLYSNSLYEISKMNRYVNPTCEWEPSRNWLDALLGIRSGVAPGFWFDIFGGYKITSSDVLFVPSRFFPEGGFGNFSEVMSDIDTKLLFVGANLKYSYQKLFEITLKGVYNNWEATYGADWIGIDPNNNELSHAWGKPEMEINAGVTVRPIRPLSIALDYYLASGRYTQIGGADEVKMNNINELNLTAGYTFNDTFGVYAKLGNVLNQKYEVIYGYPMQGFNALVGINLNF